MLVAEKQEYTDTYYSDPIKEEQPISVPRPRVVRKTKSKSKLKHKVSHMVMILVGFSLCSYTVARFAMIAENQQEILELEKSLEKQQSVQEYLNLELTKQGDLNRIEEFAKNDLEMDYPDKEQVLYVELPEKDTKETAETTMTPESKGSLWSRIKGLLD